MSDWWKKAWQLGRGINKRVRTSGVWWHVQRWQYWSQMRPEDRYLDRIRMSEEWVRSHL